MDESAVKRPRGRPRIAPDARFENIVSFGLGVADLEQLKQAVEMSRLTQRAFIRVAVMRAVVEQLRDRTLGTGSTVSVAGATAQGLPAEAMAAIQALVNTGWNRTRARQVVQRLVAAEPNQLAAQLIADAMREKSRGI